jgi:endonuclease YncB( thermonuclease family)
MNRRFLTSVVLLVACLMLAGRPAPAAEFKITKVYDGDTVKAEADGAVVYIMLVGIDAPEIGTRSRGPAQPFGDEARRALSELVLGKLVEVKAYGRGPYPDNHIVGEIHVGGMNVNVELVRQGLAELCHEDMPKGFDPDSYVKAEEEAKARKRGMWSGEKNYESPAAWRERNRIKN